MSEEKNSLESLWRDLTVEIQGLGLEKVTLKGFQQIKTFVEKEFEFWNKTKNRPDFADIHHSHFNTIQNRLSGLESQIYQMDNRRFNQESGNLLSDLQRGGNTQLNGKSIVYSDTPHAKFLSDLITINPETAQAAYDFFVRNPETRSEPRLPITMNILTGYLKAIIFENTVLSSTGRANEERFTLEKIRSEWLQKTVDLDKQ